MFFRMLKSAEFCLHMSTFTMLARGVRDAMYRNNEGIFSLTRVGRAVAVLDEDMVPIMHV